MRTTEFVGSYFDAWNHADPKAVADHLTPDGVYRDIPLNEQSSYDEWIADLKDYFASNRQRYELVGDILQSNNTVAYQYRVHPRRSPNTGVRSAAYSGAEFMTLHGDAAVTITDYYDMRDIHDGANAERHSPARETQRNKYAKSGLSHEQLLEYRRRLKNIMESEQAFLRSDLTLPKLAGDVNCSVNHLSQVINAGFGLSFFDYLNQYRIEHARKMLTKSDGECDAILNIAFTVGFNSNSAFYTAFKKRVGQTPAQYRRQQLSKVT